RLQGQGRRRGGSSLGDLRLADGRPDDRRRQGATGLWICAPAARAIRSRRRARRPVPVAVRLRLPKPGAGGGRVAAASLNAISEGGPMLRSHMLIAVLA